MSTVTITSWSESSPSSFQQAASTLCLIKEPHHMLHGLKTLCNHLAMVPEAAVGAGFACCVSMLADAIVAQLRRLPRSMHGRVATDLNVLVLRDMCLSPISALPYSADTFVSPEVDRLATQFKNACILKKDDALFLLERLLDYDTASPDMRKSKLHRWLKLRGIQMSIQSTRVIKRRQIGKGTRWTDSGYTKLMRAVFNQPYRSSTCYRIRACYSRRQRAVYTLGPISNLYFVYKLAEIYAERFERVHLAPYRRELVRERVMAGPANIIEDYLIFKSNEDTSPLVCGHRCIDRLGRVYFCDRHAAGRKRKCSLHTDHV